MDMTEDLEEERKFKTEMAKSITVANYIITFNFAIALVAGWFALYKTGDNPSLFAFWLPVLAMVINYSRGEWAIEYLYKSANYIKHITSGGKTLIRAGTDPVDLDEYPKFDADLDRFVTVLLLIGLVILMRAVL